MTSLIDSLKYRYHREIIRHPRLYAWVLNLYRAGEHYPQTVNDYFPWKQISDKTLAALLKKHAADEARHERIFETLILKMNQPLTQFTGDDVFNRVVRVHTPVSFKVPARASRDLQTLQCAHFLAHAHFLEKRVLQSFEYHLEALAREAHPFQKAMTSIYHDEARHVEYTADWVKELLPQSLLSKVLQIHREAERKANLVFSQNQVRKILTQFGSDLPFMQRLLYRWSAEMMNLASHYV